jgi:hypothetical protein
VIVVHRDSHFDLRALFEPAQRTGAIAPGRAETQSRKRAVDEKLANIHFLLHIKSRVLLQDGMPFE